MPDGTSVRASCSCGLFSADHLCVHVSAFLVTLSEKIQTFVDDEDDDEEFGEDEEVALDPRFSNTFGVSPQPRPAGVPSLPEQLWPRPGMKEMEQDYRELVELGRLRQDHADTSESGAKTVMPEAVV